MSKYFYSLLIIIVCSVSVFAQTKIKVQGFAERGGKGVKTSALVTYRLMESFPNCVVTVYLTGTTNLATIYSDASGTIKSNPFTADSNGYYSFYINEETRIDIEFSGIGIAVPFTLSDVLVGGSGTTNGNGGIVSINADTSSAQVLTVGSSGSDFNISTAGGIHTFNIPTASGTTRGLLSAADWTTFNSKQNALVNSAGLLGAINDPTGNGNVVFNNSPTIINANLITPSLGVATVSSINGLAITSGAGSSLNFGTGISFNVNESGSPVMTTRTIAEGAGLAGNIYDLSTNRTLAMGTPSTITATSINSVSGTTHTHAISSSSNPGASAAILATNGSGFLQLVRLGIGVSPSQPLEVAGNVFINSATANLYLKDVLTGFVSSTSTIISPQPNNHIRATNFTSGLTGWEINAAGDAEFNNVTVRGALGTTVLKFNEVQATAGTLGVFKSAAKLKTSVFVASSVTYGTSTVNIDIVDQDGVSHAASNLFVVNDILRLKDGLAGDTWFRVSSVSDQTTFWRYTATVMAGSNNVTYNSGMAVVDYGQSGNGFIIQTADQTNAPYLQMATHAATFSSINSSGSLLFTPQLRIGNLNGSYGFISDTYGFASGQYGTAGKSWIIAEPSVGIRLGNNTTTRIQLAADGSGFLANGNFSWDTSGNSTIAGWAINSNSIQNGTTYIASGFNIPAGQTAWFGKSASGFSGWSLQDASNRAITAAVGNGSIYPYLVFGDGTRTRVAIGGLNNTWGTDGSTNSMGMKIWDSSGNLLVHFSDVANKIAGWDISATTISSTGISITSGAGANISVASGNVILDATGILIKASTLYSNDRAYRITNAAGNSNLANLWGTDSASLSEVSLDVLGISGRSSTLNFSANADASATGKINLTANDGCLGKSCSGGGAAFVKIDSTQGVKIGVAANDSNLWVDINSNIRLGALGTLTTSATNGFPYIPTMAGAPTGTPTAITGKVPMVYDTTNNKICVYNGSWKCVALL